MDRFPNRFVAGRVLARMLAAYENQPGILVLGLPRGGVPVAYEVARGLNAPLDVFIVRKLGVPGQEELAMGAIASGGVRILNDAVIQELRISPGVIDAVTLHERVELTRREELYRGERPPLNVSGHSVFVVDDGLATGASMRAAVAALRLQDPARIIVAVPVAAAETYAVIKGEADEVVCAATPEPFYSVGRWYEDFGQTTDAEVKELLREYA
ncbi:MAG TPA: phosphoribosyltransferase [Terriglobia bacterium]|jgi:predicted phosphoribosyltransferase